MKRFTNQVAIITGGVRGIGLATAKRLMDEGAQVIVFDILEERMKQLELDLGKDAPIECHSVDISDEASVSVNIQKVYDKYGRIDILVNSAGIVGPTSTKIIDYTYSDFQKVVNVNLHGSFLVCKYVIPYMLKRNYGRILLISSIGGKEGNPGMTGYAASKSGVMGLAKGLGKEFADTGITVNALAPAVIATEMNLDTDPKMLDYMRAKIPMGRLGSVEEAAAISCWIVSSEASFNTGFVFDLSGGRATF